MSLPDSDQARAIAQLLLRQGYRVVPLDIWEEKVEEIHQGRYQVLVTHKNGASSTGERNLYQLVTSLSPDARREIFLILVGDEFKTGNGTQAFATLSDLVCHTHDLGTADVLFRSTLAERNRYFRSFREAKQ